MQCIVGASVSKLHGVLVFHSTPFTHLHLSQNNPTNIGRFHIHLLAFHRELSLLTVHGLHPDQSRNNDIGSNLHKNVWIVNIIHVTWMIMLL